MNPWGVVLVVVGILLIMIGITGTQHKILAVFKGIPTAARGGAVSAPSSNSSSSSSSSTDNTGGTTLV